MSFVQLGYSALAAVVLLGMALLLLALGVGRLFTAGLASPEAENSFLMAYSLGLIGLLCLPSVWTSLRQLLNKSEPAPHSAASWWGRLIPGLERIDIFAVVTFLSLTLLPVSLVLGHLVAQYAQLAWLVLPPLNLLASGLPVLWLALLGMRKLPGGSAQQKWGLLACALVLGPLFILVVEIVLMGVTGGLALVYLSAQQPELLRQLLDFVQQARNMPSPDQEALLRMLEPFLAQPLVIGGVMAFAALLVPMLEELFKPLGVWLLGWKKLTPAEGLVGGILSGAGFALFENLGNTSGAGTQWAMVVVSRVPAALLHMLTSGLMGWAIVEAWTNRRYLRLGLTYLASVGLHGLWNGLAIFGAVTFPLDQPLSAMSSIHTNSLISVIGLILLCIINFILYLLINRRLRPRPVAPAVDILSN